MIWTFFTTLPIFAIKIQRYQLDVVLILYWFNLYNLTGLKSAAWSFMGVHKAFNMRGSNLIY